MTLKFPFSRLQVVGNSMFPTLIPGQFLISFNWFFEPKIGDLVVVKKNSKLLVKRLQKSEKKRYFVVGDNPKASTDSRQFGWLDRDQIVGKVIYFFDG